MTSHVKSFKINELPNLRDLAARVKWTREARGWSQATLARNVGIDQTTISQMENGDIKRPRNLERLGKELGVSPAWLQFGVQEIENLTSRGINIALLFDSLSEGDKKAIEGIVTRFK